MKKSVLLSVLLLTACGTIFSGSTQQLTFDSNVKNINIYANGALVCTTTPCTVDIDRGSSALIVMAKARGYEDAVSQIKSKINTVSWWNLLSPYSWTTDFATDSMWKYNRSGVYINMRPQGMRYAEEKKFNKEAKIKAFALFNYPEIKIENQEYMQALAALTGKNNQELHQIIEKSNTEAELAHNLI